ncbi:MAG: hypothetical protein ACOCYE_03105 [Pseudomonadota bacterium]
MSIVLDRPITANVLVLPVARRPVSLLHPAFELEPAPFWQRWWQRAVWRRALAKRFADEPERVLADFGLSREVLDAYVRRPVWRR